MDITPSTYCRGIFPLYEADVLHSHLESPFPTSLKECSLSEVFVNVGTLIDCHQLVIV